MDLLLKLNCTPDLTMAEITKLLFNNNWLSDIQFHVDGKVIYAHSLELMKRSVVFQQQLLLNLGENKLIPVNDVNYDTFYQFIRFLYTDEYDASECSKTGIDLLKLAIKYKVPRFENLLIDLLTYNEMFLQLLDFCLLENYEVPLNRMELNVAANLPKILADDNFKMINIKTLENILNFEFVDVNVTEIEIFYGVMRWIEYNKNALKDDRDDMARKLLHLIRYSTMKAEELVKCVSKIGFLFTDSEYGLILRQIASVSNCNEMNLSVIPRKPFIWQFSSKTYKSSYKFITKFSVKEDIFLNAIFFGFGRDTKDKQCIPYIKIFANDMEKIEFRCYSSKFVYRILNSMGELIRLQPDIEYTIQITYVCDTVNIDVRCRSDDNKGIITDPESAVQIKELSENVHQLIFKKPS